MVARYLLDMIIISISNRLYSNIIIVVGIIITLLFFFFSDTSFVTAIGTPRLHRVINRLNVGNTSIYSLIPSVPIVLVNTIFIIIPNIFVIKPPTTRMRVDFINLFFIIDYMIVNIKYNYIFCIIMGFDVNNNNGDMMNKNKYKKIVDNNTPKEKWILNAFVSFFVGGLIGSLSEGLLRLYSLWLDLPRKEAGVLVILTLIFISSTLTALGVFDVLVSKFKAALIIPITGFAHSMTSAAMEYKNEGLVLGIGANIFKLAGSVILYGVVSAWFFGLLRLIIMGG